MFKLKEFYQYRREINKRNKIFKPRVSLKNVSTIFSRTNLFKSPSSNLGQGIIYLKASQNNTIITLTDLKGKIQDVKSCGCLGFNGKKKRSTKYAIESTLLSLTHKAKEIGCKKVAVYLNGFAKGRFYVLNCLKKSQLRLSVIRDITSIPHNGCRPKKLRRG